MLDEEKLERIDGIMVKEYKALAALLFVFCIVSELCAMRRQVVEKFEILLLRSFFRVRQLVNRECE